MRILKVEEGHPSERSNPDGIFVVGADLEFWCQGVKVGSAAGWGERATQEVIDVNRALQVAHNLERTYSPCK